MREIDDNITKKLENAARKEFLSLGYQQTSLRNIVDKCGVSTQTIYIRYGNKEGLFHHLVKDTANTFLSLFYELHQSLDQNRDALDHSSKSTDLIIDYIYDHFEDFQLIFCKAEGSQYANYLDQLIEIEEKTMMDMLHQMNYPNLSVIKFFIHKKATEGMNDLYEIVCHQLSKDHALQYMAMVKTFRFAGWQALLSGEKFI